MLTRKMFVGMIIAVLAAMTGPALGLVYYQAEYEENNGPPKAPWPPNGSTVLSPITQLTWVEAVNADSHDVYFGTSYNDVNDANKSSPEFKGNQEGTSYAPDDTMGRVKTFYWRIDEIDANDSVTKGYVWRFTYAPKNCVKNVTKSVYYDFIQDAINDANDGDVIELAEETFYESFNYNGKAIQIRSKDPNDWDVVEKTIIDDSGNVVIFSQGTDFNSILAGVTVRNGSCGIYFTKIQSVSGGTITNCILSDNTTPVYCEGGSSVIKNNIIFHGGTGIYCWAADTTVIKNNLIYECSLPGSTDAGIYFVESNSICIVQNNTIVSNDQGILVQGGTSPMISNCILWDNDDDLTSCNTTYSCIEDRNGANGVVDICGDADDPLFVDDANDDYLSTLTRRTLIWVIRTMIQMKQTLKVTTVFWTAAWILAQMR